ncbi:MAG TPA: T9SS type A sorting domain-containing protein, partial [Chitinophagales bacterium]|nr:T9SS type A sorting domain-containing protein [Chitinophagales bacterium]
VYIAGWYEGAYVDLGGGALANINPSSGTQDIFLAKYNFNGGLLWAKTFGGYSSEELTGLAVDNSGKVYVGGTTNSDTVWFNNGKIALNPTTSGLNNVYNFFLVQFDGNGNANWVQYGNLSGASSISPSGNSNVAVDSSGHVYYAGSVAGTMSIGSHNINSGTGGVMFVAQYDQDGNPGWLTQSTSLTTNLNPGDVIPYALTTDHDGNCVVVGAFSDDNSFGGTVINTSNDLYFDRFAAKLNKTDGSFMWATGAGVWQGPDVNYGVSSDNSNNVYLAGYLTYPTEGPNSNAETGEYFLEKLSANGDSAWIQNSAFASSLGNYYVSTDADGNSYLALEIQDTAATFGNIHVNIPYPNNFGVPGITHAVVKFSNDGNAQWVKLTEGAGFLPITTAGGIALDNAGCVYVAGSVSDTAYFGSHVLVGDNSTNDVFLADLCNGISSVDDNNLIAAGLSLYPNPTNTSTELSWTVTTPGIYTISITNITGQKVCSDFETGPLNAGTYTRQINVSNLSNGVYFIGLSTTKGAIYLKLVIEK